MSQTAISESQDAATATAPLARGIRWGVPALAIAVGIAVYGAYGDPNPKQNQIDAVPGICAVVAVIAIGLFALLVPAGLKRVQTRPGRWAGWSLALGVVAVLLTPVSFWSGLPFVVGTAAFLLGSTGRRHGARALGGWAVGLGAVAAVGSLCLAVLGNTIVAS